MSDQKGPVTRQKHPSQCACCGGHASGLLILQDGRGFFLQDGAEPIEITPDHWLYPYLPKLAGLPPVTVH